MRGSLVIAVLAACGGSPPPELPVHRVGPPAVFVAQAAGPDDVVVAQVAGRPVWGSCVADQVRHGTADRAAALRECIDFELLAQAAEVRGLATEPEVVDATRSAIVNRVIETDFEAHYRTPDDLRAEIDKAIQSNLDAMSVDERRNSTLVRIDLEPNTPPDVEARARMVMEKIHAALEHETGLFPVNLREATARLAAGSGFTPIVTDGLPKPRSDLERHYGDALFAIPEVGRISDVTRTKWGWDLILLTDITPPKQYTRDEVAAKIFPDLRRRKYLAWVSEITRALDLHIAFDPDHVLVRTDTEGR